MTRFHEKCRLTFPVFSFATAKRSMVDALTCSRSVLTVASGRSDPRDGNQQGITPRPAYKRIHIAFRYSVSGQFAETGWQAAAPALERICMLRGASAKADLHADRTMRMNSDSGSRPAHEQVSINPPGLTICIAKRLRSKCLREPSSISALLRINLGGSRTTTSYCFPERSMSRM